MGASAPICLLKTVYKTHTMKTEELFGSSIQSVGHKLWPGLDKVKTENRIVSLIPIIKSKHGHVPRVSVTCFYDYVNNCFYGIPIKKKPDGTYIYKRHVIEGNTMFDLNHLSQAREFAVLKEFPFVKNSIGAKYEGSGIVSYEVFDPEQKAIAKNQYYSNFAEAVKAIADQTEEELTNMALVIIGAGAMNNKPSINKQLLNDAAQANPKRIIDYLKDMNYSKIHVLFKRAYATGLITYAQNVGFKTSSNSVLGFTEPAAVATILKDPQLAMALEIESKQVLKANAENKGSAIPPSIPSTGQQLHEQQFHAPDSDLTVDPNIVNDDKNPWEDQNQDLVRKLIEGSES